MAEESVGLSIRESVSKTFYSLWVLWWRTTKARSLTPESFAYGEYGESGDFDTGEEPAGGVGFAVGFVVEDAGGGVGEESLGESPGL